MCDARGDWYQLGRVTPISPAQFRCVAMFQELPDSVLRSLAAISCLIEVSERTQLCGEGERPRLLHILLDGQVTLVARAANGRYAVIEVIQPIRHIALGTVLGNLPHAVIAAAARQSCLLTIQVEGLHELLRDSTHLANALLRAQAR